MNKKQLREEYKKARWKILNIDNSVKMLEALNDFEMSIIFLDRLDKLEEIKSLKNKI